MSPPILNCLRKEIKKMCSTANIDEDLLKTTLQNDVLKRDVVESDEAKQAVELLRKSIRAVEKAKAKIVAQTPPKDAGDIQRDCAVQIVDSTPGL